MLISRQSLRRVRPQKSKGSSGPSLQGVRIGGVTKGPQWARAGMVNGDTGFSILTWVSGSFEITSALFSILLLRTPLLGFRFHAL